MTLYNPNLDFFMPMCIQILVTFGQLVFKILSGNEILTSLKGRNSVSNLQKLMIYNPNLDIINVNVYTKFSSILSIGSKILSGNEILILIKGHNSGANLRNLPLYNPNLDNFICKCVYKIWLNSVYWFSRFYAETKF